MSDHASPAEGRSAVSTVSNSGPDVSVQVGYYDRHGMLLRKAEAVQKRYTLVFPADDLPGDDVAFVSWFVEGESLAPPEARWSGRLEFSQAESPWPVDATVPRPSEPLAASRPDREAGRPMGAFAVGSLGVCSDALGGVEKAIAEWRNGVIDAETAMEAVRDAVE